MSDKRLTRHEMKEPDQILTALDRAAAYARQHPRQIGYAGLALAGALIVGLVSTMWLSGREAQASDQLARVLETFRAPVTADDTAASPSFPDQVSKDDALLSAARDLVAAHGGARSGRVGKLVQAYALTRSGDHAAAAQLYGEVASPNPNDVLAAAAALGQASARAAAGESQAAIAQLKRLASGSSPYVPHDLVLERAAAIAEQADQLEEALALYQRLTTESDDDLVKRRAQSKVDELRASLDAAAGSSEAGG